jgi:hypothetical protein
MSPGAFKQRRGSSFGFAKRSVIYADCRCELTSAWPSRALSYHDIILSAAVFRPSRHCRLLHRRDPAHAGVCCTFPVESSLLHCCGTDVLPKEGTFHFRPALVNNGGSFQMIRFLRKNVNFIRDFWRSRFAVKLSHFGGIPSDGDAASAAHLRRNCRKSSACPKRAKGEASLTPWAGNAYKARSLI